MSYIPKNYVNIKRPRFDLWMKSLIWNFYKKEACIVLQPTKWKDFTCGHNGVFLIGEAVGFINASTLEGISGALNSSRILSEILNCENIHELLKHQCKKCI